MNPNLAQALQAAGQQMVVPNVLAQGVGAVEAQPHPMGKVADSYMHLQKMPANTPLARALKNYMLHIFEFGQGITDIAPNSSQVDAILKEHQNLLKKQMPNPVAPTPNGMNPNVPSGGMSTGSRQGMIVTPNGSSINDVPNTSTMYGPQYTPANKVQNSRANPMPVGSYQF